jgi:uncharacterized protein YecE (DUF72 family)
MGKIRIGLSGWSYDEWSGDFYPADLPADDRLRYLADRFDTVEVNGTFYSLTTPDAVRSWRDQTSRRFVFSVKGSRYITHNKRLHDPGQAMANFFASGILDLGRRLGPILWQLPPNLRYDRDDLEQFLDLLPHQTEAAVSLARRHDDRVDKASYGDGNNHRVRHVLEFRHPSFLVPEAMSITRRHGCAVACSHATDWPLAADVTAGFVYVRLHGPGEVYASRYEDEDLQRWAERVETWHRGNEVGDLATFSQSRPPERKERDVYVYFDNTAAGHAPQDALRFQEMLEA